MEKRPNLFVPGKTEYVEKRAGLPPGRCILCDVARGKGDVANLELARDNDFIITLNLYPYNPGHVMIFPARHVEDPRELDAD
jgi:ATP adenylyltransferase